MKPEDKLRELPGFLLFMSLLCAAMTLRAAWVCVYNQSYIHSLFFELRLAATFLFFILRMIVQRIIAVLNINDKK